MKFSLFKQKINKKRINITCISAIIYCAIFSGCGLMEKKKTESGPITVSEVFTMERSPQDLQRLHKVAEMGDDNALYQLGLIYLEGRSVTPDKNKGFEFMREAAAKNHIDAKYQIGLCYVEGIGTPVNQGEAAHWMISAAQQDHAAAKTWLQEQGIYLETTPVKTKSSIFSSSKEKKKADG